MLEWCGEWCAFGGFLLLLLSPLSRGLLTQLWVWSQALDSAHALGDFTTHAQNQVGSQATRDRAARRLTQFELLEEYCASRGLGPLSKKAFTRRKFDYLAELLRRDQGGLSGRGLSLAKALRRTVSSSQSSERPAWLGPYSEIPSYLNGDLVGDYGWDSSGLSTTPESLIRNRELELIHARWAMSGSL